MIFSCWVNPSYHTTHTTKAERSFFCKFLFLSAHAKGRSGRHARRKTGRGADLKNVLCSNCFNKTQKGGSKRLKNSKSTPGPFRAVA